MADIKPPFTAESARKKVKFAQAAWNTQNPERIALAYTPTSIWRNRSTFLRGRPAIISFLQQKWSRELDYRLRKELFAFTDNKIAVQFWYEYRDGEEAAARSGREVWRRAYGLEDWTFDEEGKMEKRMMSANEVEVGVGKEGGERWFKGEVEEGGNVNGLVDGVEIGEEHW